MTKIKNNVAFSLFFLVSFLPGYELNIVFDQVGSYAGLSYSRMWPSTQTSPQSKLPDRNTTLFRQMNIKLGDLHTPLRHHYIKHNQSYHRLSENRLKRLDQYDDGLDNALRVLPDLRSRRDLSASDTVTAIVKPLLKQQPALRLTHLIPRPLGSPLKWPP